MIGLILMTINKERHDRLDTYDNNKERHDRLDTYDNQ